MRVFYFKRKALSFLFFIVILSAAVVFKGFFIKNEENTAKTIEPIYHGTTNEKVIAIAVNVDWGEDIIPSMLKIFEENNVKASFFITGRFADKYPELVRQIDKAGHEIGNHGYSHSHPDRISYEENQQQIIKTEKALSRLIDTPAKLFAPPYGECSPKVVKAAGDLGYQTVMWTIDTVDWKEGQTEEAIQRKVVSLAQNGAIILMHPKQVTLKTLPAMIKELKKQGYRFEKISQIIPAADR